MSAYEGLIKKYREFMPLTEKTLSCVVSLHEGNTPLVPSRHLADWLGLPLKIYFKLEGSNPTGSFKDRGMTFAMTHAVETGKRAVICASTGNTSASAAAYATRAGIQCFVLIPEGNVARGKLSQAFRHNAKVIQIRGNFDEALSLTRQITQRYPIELVNSVNPFRIEGQKTAAFEICDALERVPDYHAIPVGNAGNITAYWKGFKEYHSAGRIDCLPKMIGFQAAGAAPIVLGHAVAKPETLATAIKIGNPASWKQAEAARDESGGKIEAVTDEAILEAYQFLASREGIFCEPASAASVAGIIQFARAGVFKGNEVITATLTGHGLKDPDLALQFKDDVIVLEPQLNQIEKVIGEVS